MATHQARSEIGPGQSKTLAVRGQKSLLGAPDESPSQPGAGVSPVIAIRYQIVVAFMQAAAVAITTVIVTLWYRRTFFTPALQLRVQASAATA